ncbi:hypothetical protein G3570_15970 [Balneolaceae bacterium YR4-1]|uniref:Mannose-1-phosphate guanyltransferase C-terminal domain-containing protein n=1 Tax=Halalkalibaculum roseum TaxID=2709311 RepID=A0A6M1SRU5_9BACT|nr:hypothetical protein [Halalkalibaculum roseum]NGP78141.1 hypothetical protein [Halalkalibaculum roseum]
MKKVLIIGAGVLGQKFNHFITHYSEDEVVGWVDDTKKIDEKVLGKPVMSGIENLYKLDSNLFDCVAIGIGYKHLEFKLDLILKLKEERFQLYTYIHPTAYVDITAEIGEGVFIGPNSTVDKGVKIKSGVIITKNVVVSHDSIIGACSLLAPSVTTSGYVEIGETCFIGTGTIFKDGVNITNSVQTGAVTLIVNNIESSGIYVGGPKLRKL